jgi:hypothetical protein
MTPPEPASDIGRGKDTAQDDNLRQDKPQPGFHPMEPRFLVTRVLMMPVGGKGARRPGITAWIQGRATIEDGFSRRFVRIPVAEVLLGIGERTEVQEVAPPA